MTEVGGTVFHSHHIEFGFVDDGSNVPCSHPLQGLHTAIYTNKPDNRVEPGRLSRHKGPTKGHKELLARYEARFPERARPQNAALQPRDPVTPVSYVPLRFLYISKAHSSLDLLSSGQLLVSLFNARPT